MPKQEDIDLIVSMGFPISQAEDALRRYSRIEDAVTYLTSSEPRQDWPGDAPMDGVDSWNSTTANTPTQTPDPSRTTSPPPSRPEPNPARYRITQGGDDTDDQLQRAIKESLAEPAANPQLQIQQQQQQQQDQQQSSNPSTNQPSSSNMSRMGEDEQIAMALEESMYASVSKEESNSEAHQGWDEQQHPQQRYRQSLDIPVALRIASPRHRYLAVFITALYACPTFRNSILSIELPRPDDPTIVDSAYSGYWSGNPTWRIVESQEEIWMKQIRALQRLFVFMKFTRRRWANIDELAQLFCNNVQDPSQHAGLTQQIFMAISESWKSAVEWTRDKKVFQNPTDLDTIDEESKSKLHLLYTTGTSLNIDNPAEEQASSVPTFLSPTLEESTSYDTYSATDLALWPNDSEPIDTYSSKSLLIKPSDLLCMGFYRLSSNSWSLAKPQEKKPFNVIDTIWLDRYSFEKVDKVLEGRKALRDIDNDTHTAQSELEDLFKSEEKDMKPVVKDINKYLTMTPQNGQYDENRKKRHDIIMSTMEKLNQATNERSEILNNRIQQNKEQAEKVFDKDDMKDYGPYKVYAVLLHTGFYGRNDLFAQIRQPTNDTNNDQDRFYKVLDTEVTEVSHEEALEDNAGNNLSQNGIYMILYSKDQGFNCQLDLSHIRYLQDAVERDNLDFSKQLPANITDSWDLPTHLSDLTLKNDHSSITDIGSEMMPES